jgi:hypothetical protein
LSEWPLSTQSRRSSLQAIRLTFTISFARSPVENSKLATSGSNRKRGSRESFNLHSGSGPVLENARSLRG